MASEREFQAAARVLRSPTLAAKTEGLIDDARQRIDLEPLLDVGNWSHGEQLLVKAAFDMWNGTGHTPLDELIYTLDDGNLRALIEAIEIRRGLS